MKKHPAKFSNSLLITLEEALVGCDRILDPFAGTGKIRLIRPDAYLNELEWEWLVQSPPGTKGAEMIVGNALDMPWPDDYFDGVVTSPTYGNRMADHHNAKDDSKRNTYRHTLGRELNSSNSGQLQWGKEYRLFHYRAWQEVRRVLKPGGRFVLNISDHIRKGKVIPVTRFHRVLLILMGFDLFKAYRIETQRQRQGANGNLRVENEWILVFHKKENFLFPTRYPSLATDFERLWPDMKNLPDGKDMFSQYPISGVNNEQ